MDRVKPSRGRAHARVGRWWKQDADAVLVISFIETVFLFPGREGNIRTSNNRHKQRSSAQRDEALVPPDRTLLWSLSMTN